MAKRTLRIVALAIGALLVATGAASARARVEVAADAQPMELNVKNIAVQEVFKLIAEAGGFNVAISGDVKGSVTLSVDDIQPLDLLNLVVGVVDAAYVVENDAVWVMTRDDYENRYGEAFVDNLVSRTVVLEQAQVKDVMGSVKTLLGDRAIIKPDIAGNAITVKASPRLVREAVDMLRVMDSPMATRAYQLNALPSRTAADMLGRVVSDQATIVEDPVGQRLLVRSSEMELDRIDGIIGQLDQGDGITPAVIDLHHVDPDTLADALRPHLTPDLGSIHADRHARRVVVVDHPRVVSVLRELAAAFDVPRRQVLLEARILQVTTSREVRSGIDWSVVQDRVNLTGNFPALVATDPGLRGDFGELSSLNYEVLVEALETFGDTELLSSPRLMVVDGGTGFIHVGSQVPYKTIDTRETPAGSITQFEKVVIVEVGVRLEVAVRLQGDDMIAMNVKPEVSSVTSYSYDVPVVDNATTDSSLLVADGNTIILGGLVKDEKRTTRKGVPLLSRIPLLKYLFSANVDETYKSEMVILITPRILTGRESFASEMTRLGVDRFVEDGS
jgi:type II secretory pathway component GspD/PulD (secretin)